MLTGDMDYIRNEDFVRFYDWTIHQYAAWWDKDNDLLLERKYLKSRLGIPSYCEDSRFENAEALIDMLAIEIGGYRAAGAVYKLREDENTAKLCVNRAELLQAMLENEWWDESAETFYQIKEKGNLFHSTEIGHGLSLLYYNVIKDARKRKLYTEMLHNYTIENEANINVESMSYYPELFLKQGECQKAYFWLGKLIEPDLYRREYPEVSFSVIGNYVYGVAGMEVNAPERKVTVSPAFSEDIEWFQIENCPLADGEADIIYKDRKLIFKNRTLQELQVNGKLVKPGEAADV